jgi:hypothetical protein
MVLTPPLATADQIVLQHAELLQVLADVRKRNKGGRNDKHDTARVRFIKDFALRGLRFGKLVPTACVSTCRGWAWRPSTFGVLGDATGGGGPGTRAPSPR